jgi:AcrR family transcriptional regulator
MDTPKLDRRIQRTQRALMDALLALSLEKGYDAVTIRDIAERADIAYSTFFRHYASKDDLLATEINTVIDDLQTLIQQAHAKSREAEGVLIFQHVAAHPTFFRVLFTSQGTSRVLEDAQREIVAHLVQTEIFPPDNLIPPEIAANYFVVTVLALIRWWLDHDMPYKVEQMASFYSRLLMQGLPQD